MDCVESVASYFAVLPVGWAVLGATFPRPPASHFSLVFWFVGLAIMLIFTIGFGIRILSGLC